MKKITVDKNEGIAEVIDRMLTVEDSDIAFVIPKGSALAKSGSNFRLLKREADAAEKNIAIESTDDIILDFAKENRIPNAHAFLKHNAGIGNVSDIVARDDAATEENIRNKKKGASVRVPVRAERGEDDEEAEDLEKDDEEDKEEKAESDDGKASFFNRDRFFKERPASTSRYDEDDDDRSRGGSGKAIAWTVGIIIVLAAAFYVVTTQFGHAQVAITFTQTPWSYQANFTASPSSTAVNPATNFIPAQIFTTQKNVTQLFPATGPTASVATKAQGTITIYNDYSVAPQDLVATTRFETPSGQIFRITSDVTVPGAQVAAGGAITPSSVTANIIADQGGPSYNVGPIAKLTIPGFETSPGKYAGFYGAILGQTTGGFIGTKMVPTLGDIAAAKASTTAILQADLQDGLAASYPNNFKILDGATDIQVTKLTVNTSTDANGNFSVFGDASLEAIGFDQNAFTNYLLGLAQTTEASSSFKMINLSYGNVVANFANGQVSFVLTAQGELEPSFSPSDFATSIAGESISTARSSIGALPQLSNGTISVWPMWLWNIPSNTNKISVTVN